MHEKEPNDSLFEIMFSQAVKDNFELELSKLPTEEELEDTFTISELHKARMRKLFAKADRQERLKTARKWSRQAAGVVVVAFTALFGTLMFTAADVRADVFSTIIDWTDDVVRFFTNGANNEIAAIEPQYIPEGYTESARLKTENLIAITYTDKTGAVLLLRAVPVNSSLEINIVDMEYTQKDIEDVIYHVFKSEPTEKLNYIVWDIDKYRYYVGGQLSVEQLFVVARSLK